MSNFRDELRYIRAGIDGMGLRAGSTQLIHTWLDRLADGHRRDMSAARREPKKATEEEQCNQESTAA